MIFSLILFSCSNQTIEENEENQSLEKNNLLFEQTKSNTNNSNKLYQSFKYFKVKYPNQDERPYVRNVFNNSTNYLYNVNSISPTVDLFIYNSLDQQNIDTVFNFDSSMCLICSNVVEVIYVEVIDICFAENINEANKNFVRDNFDLMKIEVIDQNCERWIFRDCCYTEDPCLSLTEYNEVVSDQPIQHE